MMDPVTYEFNIDNSCFGELFRQWLQRADRREAYAGYSLPLYRNKIVLPQYAVNATGYQSGELLPMLFHANIGVLIPARKRIEHLLESAFHLSGI